MAKQMTANLEAGLGEQGTDSVYLRTYSVLILMEIVAFDNANPFLDQADLDGFLEAALGYLLRERDLRSWVPGPGWANAIGHTADLFMMLARSPHLGATELQRILDAIADRLLTPAPAVFVHHEDERLAYAILNVLRPQPGRPELAGRLAGPLHRRPRPGVLALRLRQRGRVGGQGERHRLPAQPLLPADAHREPAPRRPAHLRRGPGHHQKGRHRVLRPGLSGSAAGQRLRSSPDPPRQVHHLYCGFGHERGGRPMRTEAAVALLQRTKLFAELGEPILRALADQAVERSYPRHGRLFHQGDPGTGLFVVVSGLVKVVVTSEDGDEMVLVTLGPGEALGELSLVDGGPRSASAEAMEPTVALMITRPVLLDLATRDRALTEALLHTLGGLLRRLTEQASDLVFLDLPGRMAKLLAGLAAERGVPTPEGIELDAYLTQTDLAGMVGASRQSVNQILQGFARRGYLQVQGRRIVVHRLDLLRRRAGLDPVSGS